MRAMLQRHSRTLTVVLIFACAPLLLGQDSCTSLSGLDWNLDPTRLPGTVDTTDTTDTTDSADRWVDAWTAGGAELSVDQTAPSALAIEGKEGVLNIAKKTQGGYALYGSDASAAITMAESGDFLVFEEAGYDDTNMYMKRVTRVQDLGGDTLAVLDVVAGYKDVTFADLVTSWGDGFYLVPGAESSDTAAKRDWGSMEQLEVLRAVVTQGSGLTAVQMSTGGELLVIDDRGNGEYYVRGIADTDSGFLSTEVDNHLEGCDAWTTDTDEFCEAHCWVYMTAKGLFAIRGKVCWDSEARAELISAKYEVMAPLGE
ncbi:MAG TPA: hypothetical protein PLO37_09890 [Candidatus Hydrogenedentes bacterium]|nr:hypothetical protein [Candidatus Hydrogenedentota bacterium]HPG67143.1 hypothetical protein [Candidatus Hydrogenedentota bacterium]